MAREEKDRLGKFRERRERGRSVLNFQLARDSRAKRGNGQTHLDRMHSLDTPAPFFQSHRAALVHPLKKRFEDFWGVVERTKSEFEQVFGRIVEKVSHPPFPGSKPKAQRGVGVNTFLTQKHTRGGKERDTGPRAGG